MRQRIFAKVHELCYVVHPDYTKIYHDLREIYWWNGIKKDMANFMAKCMVCHKVKVEHMRLGGLYQGIELPEWK